MKIAFNINLLGMEGLGATLSSLIKHCSDSQQLELYFLCSDLTDVEKKDICQLVEFNDFGGSIHFIDFNAKKQFSHLHSLHGDWTPYGRLLIPQLIPAEKVVYLDTDLIVLLDILDFDKIELADFPLAAGKIGKATQSWDADFYINTLRFAEDVQVFNSGVLLFNINAWKAQNMDEKCKDYAQKYGDYFFSADQTLLNAVMKGQFMHLPEQFNLAWSAVSKSIEKPANSIIHFIGSPKPWDIFGEKVHTAYPLWYRYNPSFWAKKYNRISRGKLRRTWYIKKSIIRAIMRRS